MIFPIVILLIVIFMYLKLLRDFKKNKISIERFLFWMLIWFALSFIAFFPNIITSIANFLGIERAKDFPIYVSIILLFYIVFTILIKIEKLEQEITLLVKRIALKNVK